MFIAFTTTVVNVKTLTEWGFRDLWAQTDDKYGSPNFLHTFLNFLGVQRGNTHCNLLISVARLTGVPSGIIISRMPPAFDDPSSKWDDPASRWVPSSFPALNRLLDDLSLRRLLVALRVVVPATPEPPRIVGGLANIPKDSQ